MATGGYARGVLCPGSDIDVMLLHPPKAAPTPTVRDVAEQLWYPMWDAGLKLSPAAHTPKTLLALAADDLDTATSMLVGALPRRRSRPWSPSCNAAALEQWRKQAVRVAAAAARQRPAAVGEVRRRRRRCSSPT